MSFDLVIKNAKIVDGARNPWFRGDIGINKGKIQFVGKLRENVVAEKVIDAKGMVVCPGFVDIHCHSDFYLLRDPLMLSKLKQGITTQVIGQCGISPAPVSEDKVSLLDKYVGFTKAGAQPDWSWRSFGDWLDRLNSLPLGTNVASFVGQGTIRLVVMGFEDREPSVQELEQMKKLVHDSMEEGAFGLTSGLIYPPGIYSSAEELNEIAKGLKDRNGIYLSHMRNESTRLLSSVEETIDVARKNNIPGQILHHKAIGKQNWGLVKDSLRMIMKARTEGIDITVDQYPYIAGSSTLRAILPPWVHVGGLEKIFSRLSDSDTRKKIIKEIEESLEYENLYLSSGGAEGVQLVYTPETPEYEGKTLAEISDEKEQHPLNTAMDIIVANQGSDTACYFFLSEDDVKTVMKNPAVMIGSDSIPVAPGSKCHPRTNGAFPRILGRYVRDEKILSLEEAVWKMSGFPASRLGLQKKGLIREGMDADIVIFDPDIVSDGATFENPFKEPVGIEYVLVGGELILDKGQHTGQTAGSVIRK